MVVAVGTWVVLCFTTLAVDAGSASVVHMEIAPAALLELFISGLEKSGDGGVLYGPGALAAGRHPVTPDPATSSILLDFTMTDFLAWVSRLTEAIGRDKDRDKVLPAQWSGLPFEEVAVLATTEQLEKEWSTARRGNADRHFRLVLGDRPGVRALRWGGGPTMWLPPISGALTQLLQQYLSPCQPWPLDQLERFVFLLAGRRQLERFSMLGCWVSGPEEFVCVLDHPRLGRVGLAVSPASPGVDSGHGDDDPHWDRSVREAAERVVHLDLAEVERWRGQGWVKDEVVWNRDPDGLVTPWDGARPPEPGDPLVGSDVDFERSVTAPSDHLDAWVAAMQDLEGWVEHPMAASTARLLTVLTPRTGLRFAAVWAVAPDCCVLVESHISPRRPDQLEAEVSQGYRLPGQQHLRIGEVRTTPSLSNRQISSRYWAEMTLTTGSTPVSTYAMSLARWRVLRGGVAWHDPDRYPPDDPRHTIDHEPLIAMAAVAPVRP